MRLFSRIAPRAQAEFHTQRQNNDLGASGSYVAFTCASMAACALVFSAGAQNVAHAYNLGLASSEFRAIVLALASAGASVLGPCAWLAVLRGKGIGTRGIALLMGLGCLAYAAVCSLGFVAGSRDTATAAITERADTYSDQRAVKAAARAELAALATIKTSGRTVIERRRELAKLLAPIAPPQRATAPVGVPADSQAAAVAFYLQAAGWPVAPAAVATWLNLGTVLFLEMAAALGLTVAAALYPSTRQTRLEGPTAGTPRRGPTVPPRNATAVQDEKIRRADEKKPAPSQDGDDPPPPPRPKGRPGRPASVLPEQALAKLRAKGGKASGSLNGIGRMLGTRSKTATHRLLHELHSLGLARLDTSPHGVSVALA